MLPMVRGHWWLRGIILGSRLSRTRPGCDDAGARARCQRDLGTFCGVAAAQPPVVTFSGPTNANAEHELLPGCFSRFRHSSGGCSPHRWRRVMGLCVTGGGQQDMVCIRLPFGYSYEGGLQLIPPLSTGYGFAKRRRFGQIGHTRSRRLIG